MARKSNSRNIARNTKTGANALQIQRVINKDYRDLFVDYRKLAVELIRKPGAKYVLGGLGLAALVPFAMRLIQQNPRITTIVRDGYDAVVDRLDDVTNVSSINRTDNAEDFNTLS